MAWQLTVESLLIEEESGTGNLVEHKDQFESENEYMPESEAEQGILHSVSKAAIEAG